MPADAARPVPPELDALVVGAGFNGLYQLHELRRRGHRVHLVEANEGPGGVWWANRYPGVRVDSHIPNYEFSLEEVWRDWNWSERFPSGPDLRRYFRHVTDVLDLDRDSSYRTRVTAARFDEDARRWSVTVEGEGGHEHRVDTRFLLLCTGFASKPHVPDLPGLDRFTGPCHHTGRWPGDLDLAGQRVGVIGTGASGVQVVQEAAPVAASVTVFQRTPVTALPMQQRTFTPAQHDAYKARYPEMFAARNRPPGSMHDVVRRGRSALAATEAEREAVFNEAWDEGGFHFWVGTFADVGTDEAAARLAYDFWRERVWARIDDPAVAEILAPVEPPYPFGTKRPSLEQTYYDCFNRPTVDVVDLRATPIDTITPTGIRCARHPGADPSEGPGTGTAEPELDEYELDVIVLATGFDANTGGLTDIDLVGTDGRTLAQHWVDGVETILGLTVVGFPNLLLLYGPQSPTAFCNGPTCAELQGDWMADLLDHLRDRGLTRIEGTAEASRAWTRHLEEVADAALLGKTDSWYMAANVPGKRRQLLNYPNSDAYLKTLAECAAAGYDRFVLA